MDQNLFLEKVFKDYAQDIFRYSMFRLNNRENAQDITSEVFYKLTKQDLTKIDNIKGWLYAVARNLIIDKYKKHSEVNYDLEGEFEPIDESIKDLESSVLTDAMIESIKESLYELDTSTSEIITLRVWQDLQFSEIAKITEQKESTVKLKFYRGIDQLKTIVKAKESTHGVKAFTIPILLGGILKLSTVSTFAASSSFISNLLITSNMGLAMGAAASGATIKIFGASVSKFAVAATAGVVLVTGTVVGAFSVLNDQDKTPSDSDNFQVVSMPKVEIIQEPVEEEETLSQLNFELSNVLAQNFTIKIGMSVPEGYTIVSEEVKFIGDELATKDVFSDFDIKYPDFTLKLSSFYEVPVNGFQVVKDLGFINSDIGDISVIKTDVNSSKYSFISTSNIRNEACQYIESQIAAPCGVAIVKVDRNYFMAMCEASSPEALGKCIEVFKGIETVSVEKDLAKYEGTSFSFEYDPTVWEVVKQADQTLSGNWIFRDHLVLKYKHSNAQVNISGAAGSGMGEFRGYSDKELKTYTINGQDFSTGALWFSDCNHDIPEVDCVMVNSKKELEGRDISIMAGISHPGKPLVVKDVNGIPAGISISTQLSQNSMAYIESIDSTYNIFSLDLQEIFNTMILNN